MGIDITSQIGNPSPRSGGVCNGVGMVPAMGSVWKARPNATNAPVVPTSTTTTNATVPTLLTLARRRFRAPRWVTRSSTPAGCGAASRIRVLSWSSMLGMAVLLIGVLNERERNRQMRARLEQLALHRALARSHLFRDLLRAEIEDVTQHGHLALASGKLRQRAADVDPIPARLDRRRSDQLGAGEPFHPEASQAAPGQVQCDRCDPPVERRDLLTAFGPLPRAHDRLLDGVLGRSGIAGHERHRADQPRVSLAQELPELDLVHRVPLDRA